MFLHMKLRFPARLPTTAPTAGRCELIPQWALEKGMHSGWVRVSVVLEKQALTEKFMQRKGGWLRMLPYENLQMQMQGDCLLTNFKVLSRLYSGWGSRVEMRQRQYLVQIDYAWQLWLPGTPNN